MIALPNPETAQPRLEPYGDAVIAAYRSFFAEKTEARFTALTDAILTSLAELPGNATRLDEDWDLQSDLSIDSIGLAEAAFLVEDLFGVRLDNATLQRIRTVGDLRRSLTTHVWQTRS